MRVFSLPPGLGGVTEAMADKDPVRKGLLRSAENLIGQISGPSAAKVTGKVEEINQKWAELEITIATRRKGFIF